MSTEKKRFTKPDKDKIYREQLITTGDLITFKAELLNGMKKILKEQSGQPARKWLKSDEVRKLLNISAGTLQNFRLNGTLPYTKIGGVMFYDYEDIRKVMKKKKINPLCD